MRFRTCVAWAVAMFFSGTSSVFSLTVTGQNGGAPPRVGIDIGGGVTVARLDGFIQNTYSIDSIAPGMPAFMAIVEKPGVGYGLFLSNAVITGTANSISSLLSWDHDFSDPPPLATGTPLNTNFALNGVFDRAAGFDAGQRIDLDWTTNLGTRPSGGMLTADLNAAGPFAAGPDAVNRFVGAGAWNTFGSLEFSLRTGDKLIFPGSLDIFTDGISVPVIPEPSTLLLVGLGAVLYASNGSRRRASRCIARPLRNI